MNHHNHKSIWLHLQLAGIQFYCYWQTIQKSLSRILGMFFEQETYWSLLEKNQRFLRQNQSLKIPISGTETMENCSVRQTSTTSGLSRNFPTCEINQGQDALIHLR